MRSLAGYTPNQEGKGVWWLCVQRLVPHARILARPITCEILKCVVLPVATRRMNEASFYVAENINNKSRKDRLLCHIKWEVRRPLAHREILMTVLVLTECNWSHLFVWIRQTIYELGQGWQRHLQCWHTMIDIWCWHRRVCFYSSFQFPRFFVDR